MRDRLSRRGRPAAGEPRRRAGSGRRERWTASTSPPFAARRSALPASAPATRRRSPAPSYLRARRHPRLRLLLDRSLRRARSLGSRAPSWRLSASGQSREIAEVMTMRPAAAAHRDLPGQRQSAGAITGLRSSPPTRAPTMAPAPPATPACCWRSACWPIASWAAAPSATGRACPGRSPRVLRHPGLRQARRAALLAGRTLDRSRRRRRGLRHRRRGRDADPRGRPGAGRRAGTRSTISTGRWNRRMRAPACIAFGNGREVQIAATSRPSAAPRC